MWGTNWRFGSSRMYSDRNGNDAENVFKTNDPDKEDWRLSLNMLTEFEVRRELDSIQISDAPPSAKARKLLRLGKSLRSQAAAFGDACDRTKRNSNGSAPRQFERLAQHSRLLREEVRGAALGLLRATSYSRSNPGGW
jgi:hypothetical protein